jgi:methionyl aminopeptidase
MTNIRNEQEIQSMRDGGQILAAILCEVSAMARPGVTTKALSERTAELVKSNGVEASFLGYRGYPDVICLSVNHQSVHTPGSSYELREGDLLKLDFGIMKDGLHTDSAMTVLVSNKPSLMQRFLPEYRAKRALMHATRQALEAGIAQCRAGNHLGDVSNAIGQAIKKSGFTIVRELGGHGIGKTLHEEPFIHNFGKPGSGPKLVQGMVLALEPITAMGSHKLKDGVDGFTYEMADGSLSAHFEHTVAITAKGPEVMTKAK